MSVGYDEMPSDLILNPEGIHFYIDEDGTYDFEGQFDYISIDINPFKQSTKSVFLKKGPHVISFDPRSADVIMKKGDKVYSFQGISVSDSLDYMKVNPTPVPKQLSKYSEWVGDCSKKCGYDSRMKYREIIPELYMSGSSDPVGDLEFTEDCNKMCYDDQTIFDKWKEVTRCPMTKMPESTKEKYFTTESGEKLPSSIFIENLKYSEDPTEIFSTWKVSTNPLYSAECHGNMFSNNATMNIGSRIYSKDTVGYLEYGIDGSLIFMCAGDSEYVSKYVLRGPQEIIGSHCTLVDGSLQFLDGDKLIETKKLHSAPCNIILSSYCMLVMDVGNFIINILGDTPSFLALGDIKEYRFKISSFDFDIIKVDSVRLFISSTGKLSIYNESEVWSYSLPPGGQVVFGSNGIKVYDLSLNEKIISKATGVSKYSISREAIEMFDSNDYMISICGNSFSMLTNDAPIRRPVISEEVIQIKSGKGNLQFQLDGDLVFYIDGAVAWNSNTKGKTSTHFKIDVFGEIFIMNESSVVYRSNFRVPSSTFASIIVTGEWCMICTKPGAILEVNRVIPNSENTVAMRNIVERYMDSNRSKYPAYSLKWNTHSVTSNGIPKCIPNLNNYIDTQCAEGDILCKYPKTTISGSNKYKVELPVGLLFPCVDYLTASETSEYNYVNNIFEFNKCAILGYEPLFLDKYSGYFSSPIVSIMQKESTILIRKNGSDFTNDFKNSDMFVNTFVSNDSLARIAMAEILSTGDSLAMAPNFSLKKDTSSSFQNPVEDILASRKEMLELSCSKLSENEFVSKCSELSYLSPEFYKAYASEAFSNYSSRDWFLIFFVIFIAVVVFFWCKKYYKKGNEYYKKYKENNQF